jgi:nucleoside-triphosphatase
MQKDFKNLSKIKNILISGPPGCGKTTLIKEILKDLKTKAGGFFTEEIREGGERKGFKIITLDKKEGILAHENIKSNFRVSRYGVNLKDLEEIGVPSVLKAIDERKIVVIDEIGKAELFSEKFKEAVFKALNSKNKVLGTIKISKDPFTEKIREREDTKIFYLKKEEREKIKEEILKILS